MTYDKATKLKIVNKAAKNLVENRYSARDHGVCNALADATMDVFCIPFSDGNEFLVKQFHKLFNPNRLDLDKPPQLFFFDLDENGYMDFDEERVFNSRLLALAFMYSMIEMEDL